MKTPLTKEAIERLRELSEQVITLAGIQINEPPIDLQRIANSMGVNAYRAKFADSNISGFAIRDPRAVGLAVQAGRVATIFLNEDHPLTRQNFTFSHELGHIQLGHLAEVPLYRAKGHPFSPDQEREANQFAAELLMPAEAFIPALYKQKSIISTALTFGVSVEAASIRASQLEFDFDDIYPINE
jgi:Zn-dependent peptidase ImmA (M78 family)